MAKHELTGPELLVLMVATVGHRRAMVMLGAAVVCGVMGTAEWPAMGERLQELGYSRAAVYKLRADYQAVARRLEEVEGQGVGMMALVGRLLRSPELTPACLVQ